ncbi:unnamed protein product [Psylliodes chrysocephalus]|uniref:Uncharacterized protein n=1 Tax=Psylliodes chrysocephalus TaxID=3402493 RepID=A0A9P0DBP6_9CUCU|nr:unnamed protein product [Psylliodes chrysocephala]
MLNDNESKDDLFGGTGTDSDEDYVPGNNKHNPNLKRPLSTSSSSNDSDEEIQGTGTVPIMLENVRVTSEDGSDQIPVILENTPQRGKKRLVRRQSWKRNIQKARRAKSEPYINVAGINKPGEHIGSNFHCKLKCFDEIGQETGETIFRDFCDMKSKDLHDAYLYGNIFKIKVQRTRPRSGDGNKKKCNISL